MTSRVFSPRTPFLIGSGILLAIAGQWCLATGDYYSALVLYTAALILWTWSLRDRDAALPAVSLRAQIEAPLPQESAKPTPREKARLVLLPVVLLLAGVTFITSGDNAFTAVNVTSWVASMVAFVLLFAERPRALRPSISLLPLLLLLLLGGFFYYYRLDTLPGEMTSDHAEKLTDVNDMLNGARPIFFPRNTGREPLEFYLVTAFIETWHHRLDFMALKLVTAFVGLLVVPLTFLLGTFLFDAWVGWLAGALVAINLWGIGIARMGLRFPFTPFFAALTFLFLFRALKYQRRNDFLWTGFFLGAGLYGYHAFKIVPLVVGACFLLWPLLEGTVNSTHYWKVNRIELRRYATNVALAALLTLIVFMPLFRYMVDHPESFWQRVMTRVSNEERPLPGEPVMVFADNLKNLALMFNVEGDHSWPNTLSDVPVLDEVSGALLVLGIAYALYRLFQSRETAFGYLLLCLAGLLLPSSLAIAFPIENPSVVRAGGAIPFVFILAAIPLARLVRVLVTRPGRFGKVLPVVAIVPFILAASVLNYDRYFVRFDAQYQANSWNSSEVAATLLDFERHGGSLDHAWVVAFPYWVDTRNVAINLGDIRWNNVIWHTEEIPGGQGDGAPRLYILNSSDRTNQAGLARLFPNGELRYYSSRTPGKDYVGYFVPALPAGNPANLSPRAP